MTRFSVRKTQPLVSIVVLSWNGLTHTKKCLQHLKKLDYQNYEIIVVDNGSTDGSKEFLKSLAGITYVDNPVNRGFTGGHVDGLENCSGEYIVLLNNDAVMKSDYLMRAIPHFDDPTIAAVGGRSYFWDDESPLLNEANRFYSYMNIDIYSGEALMQTSDFGVAQDVNTVSGSALMIRRTMIDKFGYLYGPFFAYFEETDLMARFKRAGYRIIYDPQLRIWHRNGASSNSKTGSSFFYYQIFRNRFIFAVRNFETKFLLHFLYIYGKLVIGSLLRLLLGRGNSTMNKAYILAGLSNLLRFPKYLRTRLQLNKQLGKSEYNHVAYSEQAGISTVIDCSNLDNKSVRSLVDKLSNNKNPLQEFILITKDYEINDVQTPNLRVLVNRGYFSVKPNNLGCLAAQFDWMVVCDPFNIPSSQDCRRVFVSQLGSTAQFNVFGNRGHLEPFFMIHKKLFEHIGGLDNTCGYTTLDYLIAYTSLTKKIAWHDPISSSSNTYLSVPRLVRKELSYIKAAIAYDNQIEKAGKFSAFAKLKNRYYRLYQFVILIEWVFSPSIPIRLKAGRLKNLVIFSMYLKVDNLAREFKHIRNEMLLRSNKNSMVQKHRSIVKKRLHEKQAQHQDITVFIICFERLEALKQLVGWLEQHNLRKIIFIDNDSSYPPLLDYYKKTTYQVLQLKRNIGHTAPWSLAIIRSLVPDDFYIVTDPDIIPDKECPDDVISYFLKLHKQFMPYKKVGFGLRIDDIPDYYPLKGPVVEWESQFWRIELEKNVYEAGIDTTFALYKPFTYNYFLHPSIRTGKPYLAHHKPWYNNPAIVSEEEGYYRFKLDPNVNSWNTEELPGRYQKAMKSEDVEF